MGPRFTIGSRGSKLKGEHRWTEQRRRRKSRPGATDRLGVSGMITSVAFGCENEPESETE